MFKKRRGIKLSYSEQGLIHFTCTTYQKQPQEIKDKIINLCMDIAGEDYKALFEVVTNEYKSITKIALEHYIGETKLYRLRKMFYERWGKYER